VWAYSTISQLGYMIMGLGAGGYFAGFFHLSTHAAFKSLLFLCSGVWIHYYETNDLFDIASRQGRRFKIPMICLVLAAASLSGIPPLSGFFSKETILNALADGHNPAWLLLGLVGAFFTPYYAFRAVFIILFPKGTEETHSAHRSSPISPSEEKGRFKESYWVMAVPLLILAAIVLVLGFFQSMLADFLAGPPVPSGEEWIFYASMACVACGLGLAGFEFGRKGASRVGFFEKVTPLRLLFANRWYLDHFYRLLLRVVVYKTFAYLAIRNDRQVIDSGLDAFCGTTVEGSRRLSRLQSGLVRNNFLLAFVALALLGLWFYFL
jgi:NADH-quinone oxidoreductase subunit L